MIAQNIYCLASRIKFS